MTQAAVNGTTTTTVLVRWQERHIGDNRKTCETPRGQHDSRRQQERHLGENRIAGDTQATTGYAQGTIGYSQRQQDSRRQQDVLQTSLYMLPRV